MLTTNICVYVYDLHYSISLRTCSTVLYCTTAVQEKITARPRFGKTARLFSCKPHLTKAVNLAEAGNGAVEILLHASMFVARERGEWWSVCMLLCHHLSSVEKSLPKRMYALGVSSPPKQRQKHEFPLSHAPPPPFSTRLVR